MKDLVPRSVLVLVHLDLVQQREALAYLGDEVVDGRLFLARSLCLVDGLARYVYETQEAKDVLEVAGLGAHLQIVSRIAILRQRRASASAITRRRSFGCKRESATTAVATLDAPIQ